MRWVSYGGQTPGLGVLPENSEDVVHPLPRSATLLELLRDGTLADAGAAALREPGVPLDPATLRAPFEAPPSIRDFMAFEQHVVGMGMLATGAPKVPDVWYEQPLFYFTNPASVIGPYDDVARPPGCTVLDAELEIAVVLGVGGSDLTIAEAERAIAGYCILNDWSARDLQGAEMRGPLGPCKGKDFAITIGPWFVTKDELQARRTDGSFDLAMSWSINGQQIGADHLDSMAWSFAEMISYASRGTTLRPGDVFGSGTCGGGCLAELWGRNGREFHPPLQDGDIVQITVPGLGSTANRVVAGAPIRQALRPRNKPAT